MTIIWIDSGLLFFRENGNGRIQHLNRSQACMPPTKTEIYPHAGPGPSRRALLQAMGAGAFLAAAIVVIRQVSSNSGA